MDLITPKNFRKYFGKLVKELGFPQEVNINYSTKRSGRNIAEDIRSTFGSQAVIVKPSEISDIASDYIDPGVGMDIAFSGERPGLVHTINRLYVGCYNEDPGSKP